MESRSNDQNAGIPTSWSRVFQMVLDEAIAYLQALIFDEGWEALVADAGGTEAALRESVRHYERGLAHLFGFVRAAGVPDSPVEWSALKANQRRNALNAGQEITLRTALDSALYAAEQIPLGDHALYHDYVTILIELLSARAAAAESFPATAPLEDRLDWAYAILADLEDHAAFHAAVSRTAATSPRRADIIELEERLLRLQRFDLVLSSCLLWLAETGGADGGS